MSTDKLANQKGIEMGNKIYQTHIIEDEPTSFNAKFDSLFRQNAKDNDCQTLCKIFDRAMAGKSRVRGGKIHYTRYLNKR